MNRVEFYEHIMSGFPGTHMTQLGSVMQSITHIRADEGIDSYRHLAAQYVDSGSGDRKKLKSIKVQKGDIFFFPSRESDGVRVVDSTPARPVVISVDTVIIRPFPRADDNFIKYIQAYLGMREVSSFIFSLSDSNNGYSLSDTIQGLPTPAFPFDGRVSIIPFSRIFDRKTELFLKTNGMSTDENCFFCSISIKYCGD